MLNRYRTPAEAEDGGAAEIRKIMQVMTGCLLLGCSFDCHIPVF